MSACMHNIIAPPLLVFPLLSVPLALPSQTMLFNKPATPTPTPAPHPARLAMLDAERARVIAAYRWERGKSEGIAGVIFELERERER